jgi:hypothetical protein
MAKFSSDVHVLRYEPILFGELHLPSQILTSGTGATLIGTTLTADDADFEGAGVCAGGVVYLNSADRSLDGAYEIVSVDSATQLTVSVLRSEVAEDPIAPPAADDVTYRVSTFAPQAVDVAFALTQCFGIQPGDPTSGITTGDILEVEGLRRVSAYAVISRVYAMWANQTDCETFWRKSELYGQLSEDARQRCRLSVDLGSDGVVDITRLGGAIRLVRD